MKREQLIVDLSPFADIGEEAPKVTQSKEKLTVRFTRDGRELKLAIDSATGSIQCAPGKGATRAFTSMSTLLSSDIFANLRKWADAQRDLLSDEVGDPTRLIPINAKTGSGTYVHSPEEVDQILLASSRRISNATEVLLIDGPAGIGKTSLISQLAMARAEQYRLAPVPLILHVKSRGRVLSNLDDLMAFSLQTIRSHVTYDQVPVLVRHGLIVVAVDGFDELGDPNGYDTAWAQLGELISTVRGKGVLILAGRDTFISRQRLMKDVNALREGEDIVNAITLCLPSAAQAKAWLRRHGWTEADFQVPAVSVLLEDGSFALRPVFLKLLAEQIKASKIRGEHERYLTPFLLSSIVRREAGLFGRAVNSVMTRDELEGFIGSFLLEVAREMADMQVEALDANTLGWIAEAALGGNYPPEIVGLIKNRAAVIALLINDERPGYKTFIHTHILNYYLAKVAIETLSRGEISKFIRRNILGAEFLATFVDVAAEYRSIAPTTLGGFFSRAQSLAQTYVHVDRGARNIGALLFAGLQNLRSEDDAHFAGFQVDDAVTRGTAGPAKITGVVVNQWDCREADLSAVIFSESTITSLIADDATKVSETFPVPTVLTDGAGAHLANNADIIKWLDQHGRLKKAPDNALVPAFLREHPAYALLGRACRVRQHWLRENDEDIQAAKVVKNEHWPMLSAILKEHGFLRVETRDASGRKSTFYHIRQPNRLLLEDKSDEDVVRVFKDLAVAVKRHSQHGTQKRGSQAL